MSRPGSPLIPEDHRDGAAVVRFVLHQVPEHPPARGGPVGPTLRDLGGDVVRRPALEASRDEAPGQMECIHDLGGRPGWVSSSSHPATSRGRSGTVVLATRNMSRMAGSLPERIVEPIRAGPGHVAGELPDRHLGRRGP